MPIDRTNPDHVIYTGYERPNVVVTLATGQQCEGELRAWRRTDTGWVANVQYRTESGMTFIGDFPAAAVREVGEPGT